MCFIDKIHNSMIADTVEQLFNKRTD